MTIIPAVSFASFCDPHIEIIGTRPMVDSPPSEVYSPLRNRRCPLGDVNSGATAIIALALFLLAGKAIQTKSRFLQSIFLPSSVIAGFLALSAGPEVLGKLAVWLGGPDHALSRGAIPEAWLGFWASIPRYLINVVFAALFIGKTIPNVKTIWQMAGPQVVFGQTLAWGQHVIGAILAVSILIPVFGMPPMAAALIEIGFEGGHGTAAGLAGTFEELGFAEGTDLALGLATIGILTGVIFGTVLINWAARKGVIDTSTEAPMDASERALLRDLDVREKTAGSTESTDPLSVHLGLVALAIFIGWLLLEGLIRLEAATMVKWWGTPALLPYVPLFPLAMIGGVIVQLALTWTGRDKSVDRGIVNRISGASLDFTIVAALAAISLSVIGANMAPFLVMAFAGCAWNLFGVIYLAPRLIPRNWFERGIGDFGQSMGMTVTGLLLMRISDPPNRSQALESFGYKQLLFEPVVGGGLFTAAAVPLLALYGPWVMLAITGSVLAAFLLFGFIVFGKDARAARAAGR